MMAQIHIHNLFPVPVMRVEGFLSRRATDDVLAAIRRSPQLKNAQTDLLAHTEVIRPQQNPHYQQLDELAQESLRDFGFLLFGENLNEKNVLLQEIHHRVKNNLAVVSGLLQLQSFKISDSRTKFILGKSTNRILSIAKVHEMLYEAKNFNKIPFKKYIEELAQMILSSMNDEGKNINIQININVNYLNINHGVPLGIIFNELITNSVKYGFTEQEGNSIFISVEPDQKDIRVIYMDNGIGIDDFESATSKSLGFTLIESLMHQIEAEFIYDTKDRFKLSFTFPANSESGSFPLSR